MTERHIIVEACVASLRDAMQAVSGGAHRLELNSGLEVGGLTPSSGLLTEVRQAVAVPIIAMVRPRAGGFRYDDEELRTMLADVRSLLARGADGIAFGTLDRNRQLDRSACQRILELADGKETVFHRAIDIARDMYEVIKQLIELGVTRVLTSGQAVSAEAGADVIATLQRLYGDRIEILPAAGIAPHNVRQLLERTGCRQVHGSFSRVAVDEAGVVADSRYRVTDRAAVRAVCERCASSC